MTRQRTSRLAAERRQLSAVGLAPRIARKHPNRSCPADKIIGEGRSESVAEATGKVLSPLRGFRKLDVPVSGRVSRYPVPDGPRLTLVFEVPRKSTGD